MQCLRMYSEEHGWIQFWKKDFECQVVNIDEDKELTIADDFLEKEEEESLIQKFSEMEIEEEDQEVKELPKGTCARKLI